MSDAREPEPYWAPLVRITALGLCIAFWFFVIRAVMK